ncbi:MAG: ribonuclease III [Oscillospiraceae bacterium]|nr:ribonuclease III [Oscillospiraceae bacterium]
MNEDKLKELQRSLGYSFNDLSLLDEALTHSSFANENKKSGKGSNERLEFLGDAVLEMTVSKILFESKANLPEGRMTKVRAEIVCEKSLASLAETMSLGKYIRLGRGEEKGRGRERPSILADTVEAVIAAIYLDGGFEPVTKFIRSFLVTDANSMHREITDYKTALQERVQEKAGQVLSYHVLSEDGPDHMKVFSVEVQLNGVSIGHGTGKSKKEAEQASARSALDTGL